MFRIANASVRNKPGALQEKQGKYICLDKET